MKLVIFITIFSVIFVGAFQRGESLKCIVCKSTTDANCASDPAKVEARCDAVPPPPTEKPPTSTEAPGTSSTETPKPSSTEAPSSSEAPTTPSSQASSEATKPTSSEATKPTSSEATKPTSSEATEPTSSEATKPTSSTTPKPTSSTTPKPTSSEATKPTSSEATQSTSSEATKPTSPVTQPPASSSSSQASSSVSTPAPETLNSENLHLPEVQQVHFRSRRQAIKVFATEGHECFKIIYKENDKEVVERGCVDAKTSCDGLKEGKSDVTDCKTCSNEDGCNSSSMITYSLTSMLLLLSVTLYLSR